MARLSRELQRQTEESAQGFEPMPDGVYHMRLVAVNTDNPVGPSGYSYWSWEFDVVEEGYLNRKQWNNTSLSPKAAFKLKETYDAFGAPLDADTDDLCGQIVKGVITTRTIQQGPRQGELTNQITRLMPKDPDFVPPDQDAASANAGSSAAEDIW